MHHGLFAVVGDVDGGDAEPALQGADFLAQFDPDAGVEVGERLVEEQHVRVDRQRPAERDALALAARELGDVAGAEAGEVQQRQHGLDLGGDLGARDPAQAQAVADVLRDGHVRPERVGLEHHRHAPLLRRQAGDVLAVEHDPARRNRGEPGDRAQQRGLARAGRAKQRRQACRVRLAGPSACSTSAPP